MVSNNYGLIILPLQIEFRQQKKYSVITLMECDTTALQKEGLVTEEVRHEHQSPWLCNVMQVCLRAEQQRASSLILPPKLFPWQQHCSALSQNGTALISQFPPSTTLLPFFGSALFRVSESKQESQRVMLPHKASRIISLHHAATSVRNSE